MQRRVSTYIKVKSVKIQDNPGGMVFLMVVSSGLTAALDWSIWNTNWG